MDIPLEGLGSETKVVVRAKDAALEKVKAPIKEVKEFLEKHKTAKIVVIIDTHCLDNGRFVWTGDSPQTYQACPLYSVSLSDAHIKCHRLTYT